MTKPICSVEGCQKPVFYQHALCCMHFRRFERHGDVNAVHRAWDKADPNKFRGAGNPNWKGDSVGYTGLHYWVKRWKPMPTLCEHCKKVPPYDLANISGKYKRDLNDWEYLCRHCHMTADGRMLNLKQHSANKSPNARRRGDKRMGSLPKAA